VKGNELADRLASVAICGDNIDIEMQLELSETNDVVDRYIIIGKWQHNWGKSHRVALQNDTREMFPQKSNISTPIPAPRCCQLYK